MSFWDDLQQASFRGIPFGVRGAGIRVGRRNAEHEYPGRETGWAEDLGRRLRAIEIEGFLLENDTVYGGGSVIAQRDQMLGACETKGPGQLVHPTLGTLTVSVNDLTVTEKWDDGTYFVLNFSFIEAGKRVFPSISTASSSALSGATSALDLASALGFVAQVNSLLRLPVEAVQTGIRTANAWGAMASSLVDDATSLFNVVGTLQGAYGRFFGGANYGLTGSISAAAGAPSTVAGLIAQGAANRAVVGTAVAALSSAAGELTPANASNVGSAAQAVVAALLASTADPADGIRLLSGLADFSPETAAAPSVIGTAMTTTQGAMADLFRRAAVTGVARASSSYQPASVDEAMQIRNTVTGLLDDEIEIAGDQAEDDVFTALRTVRQGVVTDMNAKGAALPAMQTVSVGASLPAPVLAQMLYQDGSRADQLVSEANPPHPAFMPTTFRALAS